MSFAESYAAEYLANFGATLWQPALEVACDVKLRDEHGLVDGDEVEVFLDG